MYKIIIAIVLGGIVATIGGKLIMASDYVIGDDGNVWIDDAFSGQQKQYDRELASGEEIRLGYYTGLVFIPTKILNKKQEKVVAKKTQKTTYLGVWRLSRYYSCDKKQTKRLSFEKQRTYKACMNRQFLGDGDPRTTANGVYLTNEKHANKTVACPKKYMGRTLVIEGYGEYVCNDVGGAIKGHRLDVYAGIGDYAVDNRSKVPTGKKKIWLK